MNHFLPSTVILKVGAAVKISLRHLLLLWIGTSLAIFAQAQVPSITSFTPISGQHQDLDTIFGNNFHPNPDSNLVFFGNLRAQVVSASPTRLVAKVPLGVVSDFIYVTKSNRTAISKLMFQVTFKGGAYLDTSVLKNVNQITGISTSHLQHKQLASGDFNNDKAVDLVVAMNQSPSRVYVNNKSYQASNASFSNYVSLNDGIGAKLVKQADINSDGKQDVIIANRPLRKIYIFRNISQDSVIAFSPPDTFSINNLPIDFDVNDFNQDGKMDFVVVCDTLVLFGHTIFILPNTSTSSSNLTFGAPVLIPTLAAIRVKCADFNLDGKVDLIFQRSNYSIDNLVMNTSTPTAISFTNKFFNYSNYAEEIQTGDVNLNGNLDIFVTSSGQGYLFPNEWRDTGNFYFINSPSIYLGSYPMNYASTLTDINGDGYADLISCSPTNNYTRVYVNNKTATPFLSSQSILFPSNLIFRSNITIDLDTNHTPDIITLNNGVMVVKNNYLKPKPTLLSSALKVIHRKGHTIKFSVAPGNGTERIILVRKLLPLNIKLTDYTSYLANDTFGRGSQIEPNAFVVYRGNNDTFEITGLERNTKYYFGIYEVNGNNLGSNYSSNAYLFDTSTTFEISRQVSNILISHISDSSVRVNWTKGDGHKRLVMIQRDPIFTIGSPIQNKYYKARPYGYSDTIGTNNYSGWTDTLYSRWFSIYADTGSFADLQGLSSGVFYKIKVLEFLDTLNSAIYFYENAPQRSFTTLNRVPRIDSIVPLFAKPGDKVMVYGDYFDQDPYRNRTNYKTFGQYGSTMALSFGVVRADNIRILNKRTIEATVPYGASNDFIRVTALQRGDAYATKKFQPYFLSRDTFGNGTISYLNNFNYDSSTEPFNSFAASDGTMDGIPDYYLGNYRFLYNTYVQSSFMNGSNFPNCFFRTMEGNIDDNLDLKADVLFSCNSTSRIIYTGNTEASVGTQSLPAGPTLYNHDFNKDGRFDRLIYTNPSTYEQGIVMYETPAFTLPFGTACRAGCLADLNNDNKIDVIAANYNTGKIMLLRNNYDTGTFNLGSFAPLVQISNVPGIEWIECADIDQDGREDIAISNSLTHTLSIFKNVSNSNVLDSQSFVLKAVFTLTVKPGRFKLQDISGDGKLDVVIAGNATSNGRMTLLLNQITNGDIDTTKFRRFVTTPQPFQGEFRLIDHNLDGKPEMLTGLPGMVGFAVYTNSMKLFNIHKLDQTIYNQGDSLKVSYNTFSRTFNSGNIARVQLLDASGNVLVNANLGQKVTTASIDTIAIRIPQGTPIGMYRLRIVTTNFIDTSVTSDFTLSVCNAYTPPEITSSKGFNICAYDSTQFDLTPKEAGVFHWFKDNDLVAINAAGPVYFNRPGRYKAVLTLASGCQRISKDTLLNMVYSPLNGIGLNRPANLCKGDTAIITVNAKHYAFNTKWYQNTIWLPTDTLSTLKVYAEGLYRAMITDTNQCTWVSNEIDIKQISWELNLNVTGTFYLCQGDSFHLVATTNATKPMFTWKRNGNVITGIIDSMLLLKESGAYVVMVSDSFHCQFSTAPTILQLNALPQVAIQHLSPLQFCFRDSCILQFNLVNGNSYNWYRNDTLLVNAGTSLTVKNSGRFYVKVTDTNLCVNKSNTLEALRYPQPSTPSISRQNDTLYSSVTSGNVWMRNDTILSAATMPYYIPMVSGTYKVRYTDLNGCISDTSAAYLFSISGIPIEGRTNQYHFWIAPNPFDNKFILNFNDASLLGEWITIAIYNDVGQIQQKQDVKVSKASIEIDMTEQIPGVYHLIVSSVFGNHSYKVVKTGSQ